MNSLLILSGIVFISLAPIVYRYSFLVVGNVFEIKEEWSGQIEKPRLLIYAILLPLEFVFLYRYYNDNQFQYLLLAIIWSILLLISWQKKNILTLIDLVTQTDNEDQEFKVESVLTLVDSVPQINNTEENLLKDEPNVNLVPIVPQINSTEEQIVKVKHQFKWEPKYQDETEIEHVFNGLFNEKNNVGFGPLRTFIKMMKGEDLDETDEKLLYGYLGGSKNSNKNGYNSQALAALILTLNIKQDIVKNPGKYIRSQYTREMQVFINKYFYAEKSDVLKINNNIFDKSISGTTEKYIEIFNEMIQK